jgi:tRNA A-37 threonylcarbamoyl transferase component Bud32
VNDIKDAIKSIDLSNAQTLNISHRGDGRHRVMKVAHDEKFVVLKCYGLKRTRLKVLFRQLGSLFLVRKSSITTKSRHDTELDVLSLWKREGFDVPEVYQLSELPEDISYCIAMEYIPSPTVAELLKDDQKSLAFKKEVIARYARVWGKRHARALELREPRLLQENPTLSHVFVSRDRLVHFDFEIVFTRKKDLKRLVRREIVGILRSMSKASGESFSPLLDTLLDAYPDLSYFRQTAWELLRYGTVPVMGWAAIFHRITRGKKRYTKRMNFTKTLARALKSRCDLCRDRSGSVCSCSPF